MISYNKGNHCFSLFGVGLYILLVPFVFGDGISDQDVEGGHRKQKGLEILAHQEIPEPLDDFSQVVGVRHILE